MAKYLLVYHGGGGMAATEEERNRVMAAWGEWMGRVGDKLKDPGNPAGATRTIGADGSVNEGGADPVSGYSIIEAGSMDEAVELTRGCPVLTGGGTVEIAETFDVM